MDIGSPSNLTDMNASLVSSQNAEKLGSKAKGAQTDEEMMDACKEFETYLWEQVIKSMKETTKAFSGEEDEGQQVSYFMDSAITEVASELTDQNLGPNSLAMQMYEQMKRNQGLTAEEILAGADKGDT